MPEGPKSLGILLFTSYNFVGSLLRMATETAAMVMNRSRPLGNTDGVDGIPSLHVKVKNTVTEPIIVTDIINQPGVNTILPLTTIAIEAKVGATALTNRHVVNLQALTKNVKWGYDSTCPFDIFKDQFFALSAGDLCTIFVKVSTGVGSIVVGEK